jgi:hypothetical protein
LFDPLTVSNRLRDVRPAAPHNHSAPSALPHGTYHTSPRTVIICTESQAQSKTIRAAVDNLQVAMKDYKTLMTDSTAERIDTVVKIGAAFAEVFFCSYSPSMSYIPQMNPFAKLAFGIAKGTFDVGLSPGVWSSVLMFYLLPSS